MKRRIFSRIFIGSILVSLVAVLAFAFYAYRLARDTSFTALTRGLEIAARTALTSVNPRMAAGRTPALDGLVADMAAAGRVRLTVIDAHGVVLADSEQDPATMENHSNRPEVGTAMTGKTGISSRFSGTLRQWMIYVAIPARRPDGSIGGVVRASTYAEEYAALTRQEGARLSIFAALLFIACLLSALVFSRTITAPLRDLTGVVGRFAAGDFGARLHLRRADELRTLADSFNGMGEKVQDLFRERVQRMQELDGIFSSVRQGILLLDSEGRIVRSNRGFEELSDVRPVEGKTLWEAVRAPRLTELVQHARTSGRRQSEEVALGDRWILCTVEHMADREELIVVLNDVSDVRRLETLKRDFVVNASHELRTPLTSIVGSLEMLEGKLDEESTRWVDAIRRNAERMTAIVQDMLMLSGLEAPGEVPAAEQVDLKRLAEDVTGMFLHRAEIQGLALTLTVSPDLPPAARRSVPARADAREPDR